MKLIMQQIIFLFLFLPTLTVAQKEGQDDKVRISKEQNNEIIDPLYKPNKPDSNKLCLTRKDLTTLCYALNLSKEDSLKCNVNKIWLALTDPFRYDSIYVQARMASFWEKYNKPFPSGWTLFDEPEYGRKVVLEGFFNPLIYAAYIPYLDQTYQSMAQIISNLSAIKKLKEQSQTLKLPDIKEKKARQVLFLVADSLKKYGFTLMIIQPKKGSDHEQFPFDAYNIISLRKGFEKDIIRIFKNLGLKIEEISSLKNNFR